MNLRTVLRRSTDTPTDPEPDAQRCECGTRIKDTVIAGVRHAGDELQLYCANCL